MIHLWFKGPVGCCYVPGPGSGRRDTEMETTLTTVGTLEQMEEGQVGGHQLEMCPSFPHLSCVSGLSLRVTSSGPPASHSFFFLLLRVATIIAHKGDGSSWPSVTTFPPTHHSLAIVAKLSLIKRIMSLLAFVLGTNSQLAGYSLSGPQVTRPLPLRPALCWPPSLLSLQPRWPLVFPDTPRS